MVSVLPIAIVASLLFQSPAAQKAARADVAALVADVATLPDIRTSATGPDRERWDSAIKRTSELGPPAVVGLAELLMAAKDARTRDNAGQALSLAAAGRLLSVGNVPKVSVDPILDHLGVMIGYPEADTRAFAANLIGRLGAKGTWHMSFLIHHLTDDPEERVRVAVAGALALMGPAAKDAIPALHRAYRESPPDSASRDAAHDALLAIGGVDAAPTTAPPGGMFLLPGYRHVAERGIDAAVGTIWKDRGPRITYSLGYFDDVAGAAVQKKGTYLWTKVQIIRGVALRVVMREGGVLLATFGDMSSNFEATNVRSPEDLAEVLLIVASYTPIAH